jgi:hypothetical protein
MSLKSQANESFIHAIVADDGRRTRKSDRIREGWSEEETKKARRLAASSGAMLVVEDEDDAEEGVDAAA